MKPSRRTEGLGPFDLIEEATQVFRTAPAATLAAYYAGTIPLVLGLLYFWADMSRSPFASRHLADAALGMGGLFLWMKFWQAVFARRLRAQFSVRAAPQLDFRSAWNVLLPQMILQPLGLFIIPLALAPILPFAWVYAFFQNATALADPEDGSALNLFKRSARQASLWPRQNHLALALLLVFAFCVFLNWAAFCYLLPGLLQMLLGAQSVFSKSPFALLNSTFFAGTLSLAYLCVDPLLKTAYALRCFYGEALETGEDLRAELKTLAGPSKNPAIALGLLLALVFSPPLRAKPAAPPPPPAISAAELDRAIEQTIQAQKYQWRMPRDKVIEKEGDDNVVTKFFSKSGSLLRQWARAVRDWYRRWKKKLFGDAPAKEFPKTESSGYGWIMAVEILLYGLAGAVIIALLVFLYRVWNRREKPPAAVAENLATAPDLADENIRADQLPEDGWLKLARELLDRGEFRLAMRAFYLASLAHLAAGNFVSIARFKSNRDYEQELRRRAHSLPDLTMVFGENVRVFERIWYGRHAVDGELVGQFAANVAKIKGAG